MSWKLPPERARLLALAIAQENLHASVRDAWQAVVSGVLHGWLVPGEGPRSLAATIARLERLGLVTEEELSLELVANDPAQLVVTLICDSWTVPTEAFVAALRQLDLDYRAGKGAEPG